jgi:hypothetical protein
LQLNLGMYLISSMDKTTLFAEAVVQRYLACCDQGENCSPRERGQMAAQKAIETAAVFVWGNDPVPTLELVLSGM